MPAFTPQRQSITALWPVLISGPAEGRRLSWPGYVPRCFARAKTVTHPSTNRARHRVTFLEVEPIAVTGYHISTRAQQLLRWATMPEQSGPKSGGCCVPFRGGGAGSQSNTMSPGPRPTSVPSGLLIRPTVWPQYTNATDRTCRQDRQTTVR